MQIDRRPCFRPQRARFAPLLVALAIAPSACKRAPAVQARGELTLGRTGEAPRESGELAVVFASPRGDVTDPAEVSIVFNRSMRALDLAGQEAPPPVTLEPTAPGRWQWVGSRALSFVPEKHLPQATEFHVRVAASTRALDGSALAKSFEATFSTARPAVVSTQPPAGSSTLTSDSTLTLELNQPIGNDEIARHITLTAAKRAVAFSIKRPKPGNDKLAELVPRVPLPKDREIKLSVAAELQGLEGPLPAGTARSLSYRTYGPFFVKNFRCDTSTPHQKCDGRESMSIELSNQALRRSVLQAVHVDPPIKAELGPSASDDEEQWADDDDTSYWPLPGRFDAGTTYTLGVRAVLTDGKPFVDVYGQKLQRDWTKTVEIDDLWPSARVAMSGTYIEAGARRPIPIAFVNTRDLDLVTAPLDDEALVSLYSSSPSPSDDDEEEAESSADPSVLSLDRIGKLKGASTSRLEAAPLNTLGKHFVHTELVLGEPEKRGAVAVGIAYTSRTRADRSTTGEDREHTVRIAQVTDLGILAKRSSDGLLLWITRLSSGGPVAGASVEIRYPKQKDAAEARTGKVVTDGDGFAIFPKDKLSTIKGRPQGGLVFVHAGNDFAYRSLSDTLSGYRYSASYEETAAGERTVGMAFTERGIYRPGDTVQIKGIVRQEVARGTKTPAGCPLAIAIHDSEGTTIAEPKVTTGAFGTFALEVKVPEAGKLGSYAINVDARPKGDRPAACAIPKRADPPAWMHAESERERSDFSGSFDVAEYRPAEFKVGVQAITPTPSGYVRGDEASFVADASYLFGAPMSKAEVRYTVRHMPAYFSPALADGLEGFVTSDDPFHADRTETSPSSDQLDSGNAKLDDHGKLPVKTKLTLETATGPERVTCEAEVVDLSRQSIAATASAIVHPAEVYVAIKPDAEYFVKPKEPLTVQALTVDPDGKVRAGFDVKVELVKRKWTSAKQEAGGDQIHNVSAVVDTTVASCDIKTGVTPAACAVTPPEGGYYIVHATTRDARGNAVGASSSLYAIGTGEIGWSDHDDASLDLVADKKTYQVGQTAHILVKSPFKSAEALVTVERSGVHTKRRMTLSGPMPTIDVPVTDEDRPNVFVSVLLLHGRTSAPPEDPKKPDVGAPSYRMGYATLTVDPESRRLKVALKTNKATYLPGEEATVDIDVRDKDAKGAHAEVTLYAADEGVLSLIGYKTPDPIPVFTAERPLTVVTVESRRELAFMRLVEGDGDASIDKGLEGGGGGENEPVRRDFRQSVYFNPSLVTDSAGHARVSFKLPDGLTTYRIMAVAVAEDDRFGSSETSVITSKPLMARPAFPRFVRTGDDLDAGIVVTTKGLGKTDVTVEAVAEGLKLTSEPKRTVTLEANESTEVRFTWKAERAGKAKIKFKVSGGGANDAVEIERDITVPMSLEASAVYGDTTGVSGEKLGDMTGIRDDVGGLHVSLASTALVGLGGGVEQLVEYPYGCTEQLTSRLVPLLPLRDLARDFHLSLPPDLDSVVTKTVAKILANQKDDGGFAYFPDWPRSDPWVSVYALWGLSQAKRHGVDVPSGAFEHAIQYAHAQLSWGDRWLGRATAAFAVDVLADAGEPDPGTMTRLFEERAKLPLFAEALLAHAMAITHSDTASVRALTQDLEQHVRLDGPLARVAENIGNDYAPLLDSEARTTALVLRALLGATPAHPLGARLAMGLLDERKNGTWPSTQETAWALIALDDYRRAQEAAPPWFDAHAYLGNTEILSAPFHARTTSSVEATTTAHSVLASGGQVLAFEVKGQGRMFYEARLRYARTELPKDVLDRGFFVHKSLRAVSPEDLAEAVKVVPNAAAAIGQAGATFHGGDLVLADLVVVTPSPRQLVVIDDPLPAGFEPIDSTLVTTAGSLSVDDTGGAKHDLTEMNDDDQENALAGDDVYLPSQVRRELRDDRVVFFVDHLAQGMYHYRYLARATTLGTFVLPPTRAERMYAPEIFGRTAGSTVHVVPKEGAP